MKRAHRQSRHPLSWSASQATALDLAQMELRDLPSVDELARDERLAAEPAALAVEAARAALARAREAIRAGHDPGDLGERAAQELASARAPSLRRALNATGVIVHTNLGRAPLAEAALERALEVGRSYSNLEYDLTAGTRGSRQDHAASILRRLTGAEATLVVNNNAAAVMLALAALAEGREVLVSRGELIEIGDGFRIPDVLVRCSARGGRTSGRSRRWKGRSASTSIRNARRARFRCCGCCRNPPRPCGREPRGWPMPSGASSRRPSGGSAAAPSRSPSCRASPAPSRRSSPRRCARASRRSSAASGTAGTCSTAGR